MFRNPEPNDRTTEQFRKLFIGGLNPQTTESKLREYYGEWGEIVDAVVMKDKRSSRSKGFGFITYKEPEMVDAAQLNRPHAIDGKTVESKRAMPREDSQNQEAHMTVSKLFVGGLKKEVTNEDLNDYFVKYGTIKECEVVKLKESGESRGFGFVTFDDYDAVDKAILYKPHFIGASRADVKKALSKEQMNQMRRKQEARYDGYSGGYNNDYNGNYNNGYNGTAYPQMGAGYAAYGNSWGTGYNSMSGGGWSGQMGGGSTGTDQWGAMGDGFGNYGSQQTYAGGPMRPNNQGYQRNGPYGGTGSSKSLETCRHHSEGDADEA
ncbi:unnamed protein product [Protopolystoma xenopodis]|uniref:RRM domain-containing protein n=1 Tax=Protopolystoma xenopodis TaxID=117903 RepID=A0A448X0Q9_9PLAT|nr:unnamed protein product [Protopolystoma xenopodis]